MPPRKGQKSLTVGPMSRVKYQTSVPLLWLLGIDLLTWLAFIISVIVLFAGISTTNLQDVAILTLDTSALRQASGNNVSIQDWYDAHYLSVCSGMWSKDSASAGKNKSTTICHPQPLGYTFGEAALPGVRYYPALDLKASAILLLLGIILSGLSAVLFLASVAAIRITNKTDKWLNLLRVGFLANVAATILLTISSAKITALAEKWVGTTYTEDGVPLTAWMGRDFYACTWLGTGIMWVVLGLSIAVAFKIANNMRVLKM